MTEPVKTAATATKSESLHAKPSTQQGMLPEAASPVPGPTSHLMTLHRNAGNQVVQRLYKAGTLQAALAIGHPNDVYEQEADRVADRIMRMPDPVVRMKPG